MIDLRTVATSYIVAPPVITTSPPPGQSSSVGGNKASNLFLGIAILGGAFMVYLIIRHNSKNIRTPNNIAKIITTPNEASGIKRT